MKPGSLPLAWKSLVFSIVSLLLACTAGRGTLPNTPTQPTTHVNPNGTTYAVNEVDQPVEVIAIPEPRYPKALRDSLIEGRVELRYVVDRTGHVEPNSVRILSKTREEFVEPATEAILAGVFKPARCRGRLVRQLVQQGVRFQVRP